HSPLHALRVIHDIELSQDVQSVPAPQLDNALRLRADSIFTKEQKSLVDAANSKVNREPPLFVDGHGFLTPNEPSPSSSFMGYVSNLLSAAHAYQMSSDTQPVASKRKYNEEDRGEPAEKRHKLGETSEPDT
ncbi:hypothetical protein HWV62_44275, partial [Athelia sp. TMB]